MNFLLEIGTEEIPHWMIPGALKQLSAMNLFGAMAQVDATPRRLVVRSSGLPKMTSTHTQPISGPSVSAGEKAAEGFAKKCGVTVGDLQISGGKYGFLKVTPGSPILEMLAQTLPSTILGLQWPKTMYWTGGKTGPRFIRPIRWIVALLGEEVIPFEIAGVESGSVTRGHRLLGSFGIPVNFENYESELRKNFVILSADERRHKIVTETTQLGAKLDADLIETLTFITEYPAAIRGDFDPAFLELPAEVLTTVMRHHQKYLSVESAPGKLAPHFVAVMNTSGDPEGLVKRGNERVLKARFNDARFFWNVDQRKLLADRVADLDHVTFQAKLGSYLEKTKRVVGLVEELGGSDHAQRAAFLSKADLTSEMVKEFTDLQGQIGGLYAAAQNEPKQVAEAIYDHYKPLSMDGAIPSTNDGQIVALADMLDTLRECFRIGLAPTGSKDPFALRRAAQGVVKILVEAKLQYKLEDLASDQLFEFLIDRVKYYFREIRGFKYDEINAVIGAGCGPLYYVESRLAALAEVRPTENFEPLASSFKRIKNILRQANFNTGALDTGRFLEEAEGNLYNETKRVSAAFHGVDDYKAKLVTIASLRPTVDRFFDEVMVNVEHEETRNNRLALLKRVFDEFSTIADFSEIVTSGDQKSL